MLLRAPSHMEWAGRARGTSIPLGTSRWAPGHNLRPFSCFAGGISADMSNTMNSTGTLRPAGPFPCVCPPPVPTEPLSHHPQAFPPYKGHSQAVTSPMTHPQSCTFLSLCKAGSVLSFLSSHKFSLCICCMTKSGTSTGLVPQHSCHGPCAIPTHGALRVTSATQTGSQSHHSGTKTWPEKYKIHQKA